MQYKPTKVSTPLAYFLIFFSLIIDNATYFIGLQKQLLLTFVLILFAINQFYNIRIPFGKNVVLLFLSVYFLILVQSIIFGGFTPAGIYRPIVTFGIPLFFFALLKFRYLSILSDIIYFIAIYTTVFWVLENVSPYVENRIYELSQQMHGFYPGDDMARSILIYTRGFATIQGGANIYRNSGLFHEPGMYAIYLLFAIIINTVKTNVFFTKRNIFLSLVILTTFSTTGYLVVFFLYIIQLLKSRINFFFKAFVVGLFIIVSYFALRDQYFVTDKIQSQAEVTVEAYNQGEEATGRFYTFYKTMVIAISNPIIGKGILQVNDDKLEIAKIGWGFPGLLADYGLIFGLFFLWIQYKGIKKFSLYWVKSNLYLFVALHLALLTQGAFFHTPFVMLFIIGLVSPVTMLEYKQNKLDIRKNEILSQSI